MLSHLFEYLITWLWNGVGTLFDRRGKRPALTTKHGLADILGHTRDSLSQIIPMTLELLAKHVLIMGSTGSGKTVLIMQIIKFLINKLHTVIIVDLRGDLIQRVLRLVATTVSPEELEAGRVVLFDMDAEAVVPFNPLAGAGDLHTRSMALLSVLKSKVDQWGVTVDECIRFSLIALAETNHSLLELDPLLTNAPFRALVLKGVTDPATVAYFQRFERLSPEQQINQAQSCLNKATGFLTYPKYRCLFGAKQSLSFRPLIDNKSGRIILISLAVHKYGESAHLLGSMLVDAIQDAIFARVNQPESERLPVALVIDEFENLLTPRCIEGIQEGRRFREHLVLAHQNMAQLDTKMSQTIINNAQTQFYFRTGATDSSRLVQELDTDEPREILRMQLLRQAVGECFLVQRGERSLPIRVLPYDDPDVTEAQVQAVREASWRVYARPKEEIEEELAQQARFIESLLTPAPKPAAKSANAKAAQTAEPPSAPNTTLEVREHDTTRKTPTRSRAKKNGPQA